MVFDMRAQTIHLNVNNKRVRCIMSVALMLVDMVNQAHNSFILCKGFAERLRF